MSRKLDDLSPRMLPLAERLLARCVEQGIAVAIVDTLRTEAEHQANLARGVSWTKHSKHLDGDAIDVCPHCGDYGAIVTDFGMHCGVSRVVFLLSYHTPDFQLVNRDFRTSVVPYRRV